MLKAKSQLLQMCQDMDADGNGSLTLSEFMEGSKTSSEFADVLKSMDTLRSLEIDRGVLSRVTSGIISRQCNFGICLLYLAFWRLD